MLALQAISEENKMMQVQQRRAPKIREVIETSNYFYHDLLGYKPEQTSLQQIPGNQWNEFATQRGLNPNSSGIYLPRNQTAVIQEQNPLSLFHEYFGHGLYCEQSLSGRKLIHLEKGLLDEEKQEFDGRQFNLEDLKRFREGNLRFQELDEFRKQNLAQYEIFAIWTEYLLSKENKLESEFEMKYDSFEKEDRESIDSIINFTAQYGNLATFYAQGLARRTTPERVRKLLENIYGDKLKDIKFASLYGSRKEFSDIDVFVVSDNLQEIKTDWLDISTYSVDDFKEKLRLFDVALTDVLSSGELVLGDEEYFVQQRLELERQPITKHAIRYNLKESIEQNARALQYSDDSKKRRIGLSYALTSKLMAENLEKGEKKFTKKALLSNSQSETFIELKGGIME